MQFIQITESYFEGLKKLQKAYKQAIGETLPGEREMARLLDALRQGGILFYGCLAEGDLVACCSVSLTFSTFNYQPGGVFEDFYILPQYRHRGLARQLVSYAVSQSGVRSLTVGCADCDRGMYQSLGFSIPLGSLLAYGME